MNEVVNLLKSHKSIRNYKDRPVEEEKVKAIIECAQSASTSNFIQAYTIIRVNDAEKRKAIAHLAGDQNYVVTCPLFLMFCADLSRGRNACKCKGELMMAEGYTEAFMISTIDAALAAQNALVAAESLGLGGVYIGGIRNNPEEVCKLLNIKDDVYPVFGMCIGYPEGEQDKKERLPMEVILKEDEYNTSGDAERIRKYDEKIKEYYIERTNGEREDTWTDQMAKMFSKPLRPHMKEFLEKHGFNFK